MSREYRDYRDLRRNAREGEVYEVNSTTSLPPEEYVYRSGRLVEKFSGRELDHTTGMTSARRIRGGW